MGQVSPSIHEGPNVLVEAFPRRGIVLSRGVQQLSGDGEVHLALERGEAGAWDLAWAVVVVVVAVVAAVAEVVAAVAVVDAEVTAVTMVDAEVMAVTMVVAAVDVVVATVKAVEKGEFVFYLKIFIVENFRMWR